MKSRLAAPGLSFEYRLADIRDVDTESLLASTVRRILGKIASSPADERAAAMAELTVLAGLRELEEVIEREIEQMPIPDDIIDHEVLGRERKRGIELGKRGLVLDLMETRFGHAPDWVKERVNALSVSELQQIGRKLFSAGSLEDLLK